MRLKDIVENIVCWWIIGIAFAWTCHTLWDRLTQRWADYNREAEKELEG